MYIMFISEILIYFSYNNFFFSYVINVSIVLNSSSLIFLYHGSLSFWLLSCFCFYFMLMEIFFFLMSFSQLLLYVFTRTVCVPCISDVLIDFVFVNVDRVGHASDKWASVLEDAACEWLFINTMHWDTHTSTHKYPNIKRISLYQIPKINFS